MGCFISCSAFEKLSPFLEWAVWWKQQLSTTAHYLNNFLFIDKAESGQCSFLLETFCVMRSWGFPLSMPRPKLAGNYMQM